LERLHGNLSNEVRLQLLTAVANKTMSLEEIYLKAADIKKLQHLRQLVKNYLHVETFDIAMEQHPDVLEDKKLQKYLTYRLDQLPTELKVSFLIIH